ncbi:DNA-binding protein WhiA [Clostridiaceae bacterium NSJ-31]|uniref:Probable cell division protein WhiA n=1 Tax=Ligaoa zhengdingensis TaxID=2763658 RepID=A0A926DZ93_9FIRM|nr:DNA-binding protein WhiA [Ligaoa zhengdingensis]MBC8546658.1 DNA-binding protein WhiA [Ligaoa zhengdingensis]
MSFAHQLKQEIYEARPTERELRLAQAYGLLLFSKGFSRSSVSIQTEHEQTARLFCSEIIDLIGIKTSILYSEFEKKNGSTVFTAAVEAEEDRENILRFFGHDPDELSLRIHEKNLHSERAAAAFVAGAYLACGNVTDPQKDYHLEFVTPHRGLCRDLIGLLSGPLEPPRMTTRRSSCVAYLKESEAIEDMMTYMGAPKCALAMMEISIYKDMRNKVNRVTNCETANIEKTVTAAAAQCEDIRTIIAARGLESLPDELREIAELRVQNPDMSLRELGEALSEPLSRSGVNHRLKRLSAIADQIRGTK